MNEINKTRRSEISAANQLASGGMGMMSMMDKMAMEREKEAEAKKPKGKRAAKAKTPWDGYGNHLMRASELPSPAPNGHFLREFGQSDRELIENSHTDTSVSQALSLLNGPVARDVLGDKSVLKKRFAASMTTDEKIDTLFMSVLARKPTDAQREIARSQLESNAATGADNLIWALMTPPNSPSSSKVSQDHNAHQLGSKETPRNHERLHPQSRRTDPVEISCRRPPSERSGSDCFQAPHGRKTLPAILATL